MIMNELVERKSEMNSQERRLQRRKMQREYPYVVIADKHNQLWCRFNLTINCDYKVYTGGNKEMKSFVAKYFPDEKTINWNHKILMFKREEDCVACQLEDFDE